MQGGAGEAGDKTAAEPEETARGARAWSYGLLVIESGGKYEKLNDQTGLVNLSALYSIICSSTNPNAMLSAQVSMNSSPHWS